MTTNYQTTGLITEEALRAECVSIVHDILSEAPAGTRFASGYSALDYANEWVGNDSFDGYGHGPYTEAQAELYRAHYRAGAREELSITLEELAAD